MKYILVTVLLALTATTANAMTYQVKRELIDELGRGTGTVTGFIETDGALGVLSQDNILNWSLTVTAAVNNNGFSETISLFNDQGDITGDTNLEGRAVEAEGSRLWYDFGVNSGTRGDFFYLAGDSGIFWCLETTICRSDSPNRVEQIGAGDSVAVYMSYLSTERIPFAEAVIPVPAAVWLFGSGLLGLFGLARIRR